MKQIITIFLLFIISIQCLPVKELGKCLIESSFVEEDVCGKSLDKKETIDFSIEFCVTGFFELIKFSGTPAVFCKKNKNLFLSHVVDVTTQPPNA